MENNKQVFGLYEFLKNGLETDQPEIIKNDYETFKSFVAQYPAWLDLAIKYKKNPGALLNYFSVIGQEVLNRSNDILINEISAGLKNFVSAKNIKLSDGAITALDDLIIFMKTKTNEVKNV